MLIALLLTAFAFSILIRATPTASTLTAANLITLAPSTSSCLNAPYPTECATARTAAPNIAMSFLNLNITSFAAQAALVALQLYESSNFQYSRNHYPSPGTPGQGTRNMQSPTYNAMYATWLATECANCGISVEEVEGAKERGPTAVLELVIASEEWSFGSAAWFLRTQCEDGIEEGLASGSLQGWEDYTEQCVGTTVTEDRTAVWRRVMALGRWG